MIDTENTHKFVLRTREGETYAISFTICPRTLAMIHPEEMERPAWTRLEHMQCACCPLSAATHPHCPAAVNIVGVVEQFKGLRSFDICEMTYVASARRIIKSASVSEALTEILFFCLSTSQCPIYALFRPFARNFNPFPAPNSIFYAMASLWILGQYFNQRGRDRFEPDFAKVPIVMLNGGMVISGLFNRIKELSDEDGHLNALVQMDSVNQLISIDAEYNFKEIEVLFEAWIKGHHLALGRMAPT